jgi:hypothetical protein
MRVINKKTRKRDDRSIAGKPTPDEFCGQARRYL